eukprot:TRINITY_DN6502_c0_g1_i1.p1 TRINITY_DN6502_c0_g1~~TRINITY_DN6502_c0_g1_i1.p1  ORF type:complete len:122 (-),score=22.42 TRINITY_DN6502_c0_g1_i1:54-419(-)
MISAVFYLIGNFIFIPGSVFYFPVLMEANDKYQYAGSLLFVWGSAFFMAAGLLDLVVMTRPAPEHELLHHTEHEKLLDKRQSRLENHGQEQDLSTNDPQVGASTVNGRVNWPDEINTKHDL